MILLHTLLLFYNLLFSFNVKNIFTGAFGGSSGTARQQTQFATGNSSKSDSISSHSSTSSSSAQIQVIQTLASVACVKWRSSSHPQQLASSSTVVDPTINVWDVRHPYVPIACFDGHRSAVTDVTWMTHPYNSNTTQLLSW